MFNEKKIVCVIPARLASSRFPKKILADLGGKPLLQRVWEAAVSIPFFDGVVIALDDEETAGVVDRFGGKWVMTDRGHESGTSRLIEVKKRGVLEGDVWVNWQADEPFVSEEVLRTLLETVGEASIDVWTLKKKLNAPEEAASPHVVKVVSDACGRALYFSRQPLVQGGDYFKHIGLYAYSNGALGVIAGLPPSELERGERLEQLRFLEQGLKIFVATTEYVGVEVNVPEDLIRAESHLASLGLS